MAKIKHHEQIDSINEVIEDAKRMGILHLQTNEDGFNGRHIYLNGKQLINFGTCGYLGLEMDERLIKRSIEYTQKYGTQYSVSRVYLTNNITAKLEESISKMYGGLPVIVQSSTSACHISNFPTLVGAEDVVILDQQAHMSMLTGVQLLRQKGVVIDLIRHSNLEMLEEKIKQFGPKCSKIWYVIDGLYSMYGDYAPMLELNELMKRYKQLHVYVDDAHGISWTGPNGAGRVYELVKVPERLILVGTLAKGFGSIGGVTVFPNKELYHKVKLFGGPLTYSHPLAPGTIGAAQASAEIHLSPEIYILQQELKSKLAYADKLLAKTDLLVLSHEETPIYFIGAGMPKAAINFVNRLIQDGFYVNIGMFPAVPVKNSGLRFTINNHLKLEDISQLVECMAYHFPKVMAVEGRTIENLQHAFRIKKNVQQTEISNQEHQPTSQLKINSFSTAFELKNTSWDTVFEGSRFTCSFLQSIELAYKDNPKKEENFEYEYLLVVDESNEVVFATFLSCGIIKDDFLAAKEKSMAVEIERNENPYFLTSKTLQFGSLFTEGNHWFLKPYLEEAVKLKVVESIAKYLEVKQREMSANTVVIRDFGESEVDSFLFEAFKKMGYVPVNMPNANSINFNGYRSLSSYFEHCLTSKQRLHIRKEAMANYDKFDFEAVDTLTTAEIEVAYALYGNVHKNNLAINLFPYPKRALEEFSKSENWHFLKFYNRQTKEMVACIWCIKGTNYFNPVVIGMDYKEVQDNGLYRVALYRILHFAIHNGYQGINLGYSADLEKWKFGAKKESRKALFLINDSFNLEYIEQI